MDAGFFIAQKQENGSVGKPLGNEEGAIMLFEELDLAKTVRDEMVLEHGPLSIYKVNIVFVGEVLA